MEGTFFDRWLLMSGWMQSSSTSATAKSSIGMQGPGSQTTLSAGAPVAPASTPLVVPSSESRKRAAQDSSVAAGNDKRPNLRDGISTKSSETAIAASDAVPGDCLAGTNITGQAELERLIRAVASNPALTPVQKNTTIQGLRDSVWKSNRKQRDNFEQTHAFAPQTSVMTR